jgi:hypothetical protein
MSIPLNELAAMYRTVHKILDDARAFNFPRGTKVNVKADRYNGPGIVAHLSECPPDQVPVLLGNGNTWWYPIETVTPIEEQKP